MLMKPCNMDALSSPGQIFGAAVSVRNEFE